DRDAYQWATAQEPRLDSRRRRVSGIHRSATESTIERPSYCPANAARALRISQAFFASAVRIAPQSFLLVFSPQYACPVFKYINSTSCPASLWRAMVPPQPHSGSPGCPPVTMTFSRLFV